MKDRTWLSTFALQIVDGADPDWVEKIMYPFMSIPKKFIVIDIPVEETLARMKAEYDQSSGNREPDWRDKREYEIFSKIREKYLKFVAENKDWCTLIDCFDSPARNAAQIKLEVLECLNGTPFDRGVRNDLLNEYSTEAAHIIETSTTRRFLETGQGTDVQTYNIEDYSRRFESARRELNLPTYEVLQREMHEKWRFMGLEGANNFGTERLF